MQSPKRDGLPILACLIENRFAELILPKFFGVRFDLFEHRGSDQRRIRGNPWIEDTDCGGKQQQSNDQRSESACRKITNHIQLPGSTAAVTTGRPEARTFQIIDGLRNQIGSNSGSLLFSHRLQRRHKRVWIREFRLSLVLGRSDYFLIEFWLDADSLAADCVSRDSLAADSRESRSSFVGHSSNSSVSII